MALIAATSITFLSPAFSQTEREKHAITVEVRKLDSLHAAAVLSGNLHKMDKYWREDLL